MGKLIIVILLVVILAISAYWLFYRHANHNFFGSW